MRVDIWSDVVCPWCYVGRARFSKALGQSSAEIVDRSFELDPGWPQDATVSATEMLSRKFGMPPDQARQAEERVAGLARAEGLGFEVERPYGNTFRVHRVLQKATAAGNGQQVRDVVDQAYFAQALDIFDEKILTEITGITVTDDEFAMHVRQDEQAAGELGITGVPFFVFDGRLAVSGAQPTQTFAEALRRAATTEGDTE
jgi:predicted DsbA family dithiol-disulfide isomerase